MTARFKSLAEVAPDLIPKRWASSPMERARQIEQVQIYLASEAVVTAETERDRFGLARGRAVFAAQIGAYYSRTTGPICDFVWDKITWLRDQVTDAVSGLATVWPFTLISDIWNALAGIGSTIYDWARSAIEDTVGGIVSVATDIWNAVRNIARTIYNQAASAVSWAIRGLVSTAGDIWGAVRNFGGKVWNAAKGALEAVIDPLWGILDSIKGFFAGIWSALKGLPDFLASLPGNILNALRTVAEVHLAPLRMIWNALKGIPAFLGELPGQILNGLKQIGTWIYEGLKAAWEFVTENVWPVLRAGIEGLWHVVSSGINWIATKIFDFIHWAVDSMMNFGGVLVNTLISSTKKMIAIAAKPLGDFFRWTMREMVAAPIAALGGRSSTLPGIPEMVDAMGDVSGELYTTLRDGIQYEPPATFEKAEDAAGDFLTYGLVFGGMDSMITLVEESASILRGMAYGQTGRMINLGKEAILTATDPFKKWPNLAPEENPHFGGIAKFFKSAYYALGLGFMMWTIWSGSLRALMADPREVHYRRLYRTRYPTESQEENLIKAQAIRGADLEALFTSYGYNDREWDLYKEEIWDRLPRSLVTRMVSGGIIEAGNVGEYTKWFGYNKADDAKVQQFIVQDAMEDKWDDMRDAVEEAYEVGVVTPERALHDLQAYGAAEWKASYTLNVIDLQRLVDFAEDAARELRKKFDKAEINEATFRKEAGKFITNPDVLEQYVVIGRIRRGEFGQIGLIGRPRERKSQIERRVENLERQIDRLQEERADEKQIWEQRIDAIKQRMRIGGEKTREEYEHELELALERMGERDQYYAQMINELLEERSSLAVDLEALETFLAGRAGPA